MYVVIEKSWKKLPYFSIVLFIWLDMVFDQMEHKSFLHYPKICKYKLQTPYIVLIIKNTCKIISNLQDHLKHLRFEWDCHQNT